MGLGLVTSLARPGGNLTGVASVFPELGSKLVELLKEAVPSLTRVAVLWDPSAPGASAAFKQIEQAAHVMEIALRSFEVRQRTEVDGALSALASRRADGLIVLHSRLIASRFGRIRYVIREQRLPAISNYEQLAWTRGWGVLMSYGPSQYAAFQRAAHYARQILEGAKPGDLPVERPQFDLVLNLKSAKALGITLPNSLLIRATAVLK